MAQYEPIEFLGRGAFGSVIKTYDSLKGEYVAVKMIESGESREISAEREIRFYEHLQQKTGTIQKNVATFIESFKTTEHFFIIMELLDTNLDDVMNSSQNEFEMRHLQEITKSVLSGLQFLHQNGVIHTDLKLDNIVLKHRDSFECKIIDLGLSLFKTDIPTWLNDYQPLQNVYYRAPEIFLKANFDEKIDLFSLGSIVGELCNKKILFRETETHQRLATMVEYLGLPPRSIIESSRNASSYFDIHPVSFTFRSIPGSKKVMPNSRNVHEMLNKRNETLFTNFISSCLSMDPSKRGSAELLSKHSWLAVPEPSVKSQSTEN